MKNFLELGNLMFNTNKNQIYKCDNYIVALLKDFMSGATSILFLWVDMVVCSYIGY